MSAKREKDFVELSAREQENSRLRKNLIDIFDRKHLNVHPADNTDNPSQLSRLNYSLNFKNRAEKAIKIDDENDRLARKLYSVKPNKYLQRKTLESDYEKNIVQYKLRNHQIMKSRAG